MDTEKIEVINEVRSLCKRARMMRSEIACALRVSERTLIRWLNGETIIDLLHYNRLLNLVNKRDLAMLSA